METCANLGIATRAAQGTCLAACSACAGDYEDPDRTASEDDQEESVEQGDEKG